MAQALWLLESDCLYYRQWASQIFSGRKYDAPISMGLPPEMSTRGGDNKTSLGESLPRRNQQQGRKNFLSQGPSVRDQGKPWIPWPRGCGQDNGLMRNGLHQEKDGLLQTELSLRITINEQRQ